MISVQRSVVGATAASSSSASPRWVWTSASRSSTCSIFCIRMSTIARRFGESPGAARCARARLGSLSSPSRAALLAAQRQQAGRARGAWRNSCSTSLISSSISSRWRRLLTRRALLSGDPALQLIDPLRLDRRAIGLGGAARLEEVHLRRPDGGDRRRQGVGQDRVVEPDLRGVGALGVQARLFGARLRSRSSSRPTSAAHRRLRARPAPAPCRRHRCRAPGSRE